MTVYKWPRSTMKELELHLKNFIWTGNPEKWKFTTVAWHKVCAPIQEGGIGIRYLKDVNLAMLMQMAWALQHEDSVWGRFMRGKYLNKNQEWSGSKHSTVWSGMKYALKEIRRKQAWLIGNRKSINLWKDHWIGEQPLCDYINPRSGAWNEFHATLSCCIENGQWSWPTQIMEIINRLGLNINEVSSPNVDREDEAYWQYEDQGRMTARSAMEAIRNKQTTPRWNKFLRSSLVHPRTMTLAWKILHNAVNTDDNLKNKSFKLASRCSVCKEEMETKEHIFFSCREAIK